MLWYYHQHFASNGRNNRDDHDRQDYTGGEHGIAERWSRKQARPTQGFTQERIYVTRQDRYENEDCPQPVNHAGDCGQQLYEER